MSLNADFIYNDDWHDVSNRVVFNYFSALHPDREDECSIDCQVTLEQLLELHKMLCDILYKEQALPKVSYHDKVLNSPDLVNISEIAKDYPISAIKLNKILQEEGKDKKGEWVLYAKYKDRGYASTKTQVVKNGEYEVLKVHLKWSQRGRLFIYELLKSKGILPICEQL